MGYAEKGKCDECDYFDETGGIVGEPYCAYSSEGYCIRGMGYSLQRRVSKNEPPREQ